MAEEQHVIVFLKKLLSAWSVLPFKEKVSLIFWHIMMLVTLNIILMAIVFNIWIIPRIEKRIGEKLFFTKNYNYLPFAFTLSRNIEVAKYIVLTCLGFKIKKSSYMALAHVNYQIKEASRFEIFMSFIAVINMLILVSGVLIFWVHKEIYHF